MSLNNGTEKFDCEVLTTALLNMTIMAKPKIILVVGGVLIIIGIGVTVYQSQTTLDNQTSKQQNQSESMTILDILVSIVLVIGLGSLVVGMLYLIKSRSKTS